MGLLLRKSDEKILEFRLKKIETPKHSEYSFYIPSNTQLTLF